MASPRAKARDLDLISLIRNLWLHFQRLSLQVSVGWLDLWDDSCASFHLSRLHPFQTETASFLCSASPWVSVRCWFSGLTSEPLFFLPLPPRALLFRVLWQGSVTLRLLFSWSFSTSRTESSALTASGTYPGSVRQEPLRSETGSWSAWQLAW